jgi:hypothetical protein
LLAEFSCQEVAGVTGQVIKEGPVYSQSRIRIDGTSPSWFEIASFGGIGSGSNMAFRRNVLSDWPGFKECLGRGQLLDAGEDHYAFFTLVHRGHTIVYAPAAKVQHPEKTGNSSILSKLHSVVMSSAYITLLACEHSIYIPDICRFLLDAVRRTPRSWRSRPRRTFDANIPTSLVYSALLVGPFIYFYMRFTNLFKRRSDVVVRVFESKVPN